MDMEKMIVVEKSTKWWMTAVASASLAVGAVGGYGIGALTQRSPQQSSVQATMPQQNNQESKMSGQGGQPPQGNGQQGGSQQQNKSKKKPSNADGTTKDDKSGETIENNSKTTNS